MPTAVGAINDAAGKFLPRAASQSTLPFSKFDPNRPAQEAPQATTPSGARRVLVLQWVNPLVFAYTAFGFAFIVYLMARKWTPHPVAFSALTGGTAIAGYMVGRLWAMRGLSRAYGIAWIAACACTLSGFALMGCWLLLGW